MTIWKATALLIVKLAELVEKIGTRVLPCSHAWKDQFPVEQTYGGKVIGQTMCQRCAHCGKFRELKMY